MSLTLPSVANSNDWIVGVVFNVTGNLCINLSANFLKYSHNIPNDRTRVKSRSKFVGSIQPTGLLHRLWNSCDSYTRRRVTWIFSMILFLLGNILNFLSFAYAAQTMLAAIGSVQFVSNVFLAFWLLGEPITCLTLLGTALIVLGNIVVVTFSSHADIQYSVLHLHKIFTGSKYGWYIAVAGGAFVVLSLIQLWLKHRISTMPETMSRIQIDENDELESLPMVANHKLVRLYAIIYILNGGIVGTQAVTYAKALSTVLRVVSRGDTRWLDITETRFTYYVFAVWIICMAFWLWRRDRVLRQHDAMFIVPVLQVVWISLSIAQGGVYFNEFQGYTFSQFLLFGLGIMILLIGVGVLALTHVETADPNKDGMESITQPKEEYTVAIKILDNDDISCFPDKFSDAVHHSFSTHVCLGLATSIPMGIGSPRK